MIMVTAIELCPIKLVERDKFLRLIEHDGNAALAGAVMLAQEANTGFDDVYELLLARSSTEKRARLLLSRGLGRAAQPRTPSRHGIHP
jgi:hypothetical protein